ncbi:MAG: N-acetylmuramic acid 6-phosphate etherase [Acidobacteria bacterium]|nr:N-acetylmuramic acid 6-phosphate etherase [Acidobacteriota bacterium]
MNESDQFAALREELGTLVTEAANPKVPDLDALSTAELAAAMNAEDARVPLAISAVTERIATVVDAVAAGMAQGGRLIYVGAGTPGRIGILDASECPPTFGTDPAQVVGIIAGGAEAITNAVENAEDDTDAGRADMAALTLTPHDVVVGISASGRTPYVIAAIEAARTTGATTVGFACNVGSPLAKAATMGLEIEVGPEFLAGSTRLKSGTAQKLVLNMISTLAMVRLGKTYKNLMVDLRATNAKLQARSQRTVMAAAEVDAATATATLASVNGSVKAAILVLLTGIAPATAATALEQQYGALSAAVRAESGRPAQ